MAGMTNLWEIEQTYFQQGVSLICGADEAGAGPLAGAVYAGAVILPAGWVPEGLDDSKKVSEKNRERLYDEIIRYATAWAIATVDEREIDAINILNARLLAMNRAILALKPTAEFALIDGNRDKGIDLPHLTVVGGDGLSANIAAASILAKVSRDRYMTEMDARYPQYGFAKHKGYPTRAHYEALDAYGPCPIHRKTFLKKWYKKRAEGGEVR
ncbi:MAG: ribonuclease HII [Oscillospiraceae bacterium]